MDQCAAVSCFFWRWLLSFLIIRQRLLIRKFYSKTLPCFKLTNFLTHILKVLFPRCIFLKSHFFNICWKYHVACRWRMLSFYKFFFILVSRINKFSSLVECLCGEHVIESIWYSLLRRLPHHLWLLNYIIFRVDMICNAGLTHW